MRSAGSSTISTGRSARSASAESAGPRPRSEQPRVQPAHELADLLQRQRQLRLGRFEQLRHLAGIGLQAAADEMQVERDGDEPLLRPVEVALDAAPLGVTGGDDAGAGLRQVADRLTQVGHVADDRDHLVVAARDDAGLEVLDRAVDRLEPIVRRRERACLESPCDRAQQRVETSAGRISSTLRPRISSGGWASFDMSPASSRYSPSRESRSIRSGMASKSARWRASTREETASMSSW